MMGVSKFYLYSRFAEGDWSPVLQPYIDRGIVDLTEWPYPAYYGDGRCAQIDANQHCIDRLKGQDGWLAFIDSDEFLFSPKYDTITEALATFPKTWGAVGAHWMMFGSSGRKEWSPDPVIERFTWRPADYCFYNWWYKSIVRLDDPDLGTLGSRERFRTARGTFNEEGTPLTGDEHPHRSAILRLNHYFTKSREEWEKRHPIDNSGETHGREEKRWSDVQSMDVDDRTIQRFLPGLKRRLA